MSFAVLLGGVFQCGLLYPMVGHVVYCILEQPVADGAVEGVAYNGPPVVLVRFHVVEVLGEDEAVGRHRGDVVFHTSRRGFRVGMLAASVSDGPVVGG